MIQIETLSGQIYDKIWLGESDYLYKDIIAKIQKNIKTDYPEYNPIYAKNYTMYVKTDIKLFNKGKPINLDDNISFDENDNILQIVIANKYICRDYHNIHEFDKNELAERVDNLIREDWRCLNLGKEFQTKESCRLASRQKSFTLMYIEIQSEELCKFAIQQYRISLPYFVKIDQTEEICKLAVQQNGYDLRYVKNQTEEICKLAVQQNGWALEYVKNQTEEICKLAVQQDGLLLKFVKEQTEEICKLAVQQDGFALYYVKKQTEEICKLAVQKNGNAFRFVKNKTKEIRELAGDNSGCCIIS